MKIIKKIFNRPTPPPYAPCGHRPPVFRAMSGRLITVLMTPRQVRYDYFPGAVWCGECGWVKISDDQYNHYRKLNGYGSQKTQ